MLNGHGLAVALALSLGFAAVAQADEAAPPLLRIGTPKSVGLDGRDRPSGGKALVDAVEQEFAGTGTKVEWVYFVNVGPGVNEAFAGKQIDFANYGDFPSVIARAGNLPIKLLVPATRGTLESYLVVPADSTATSIRDLKGKRVSVNYGRPWMLAFERLIAANGLKLSDFQLYNLVMPDGDAAVISHAVDAQYTLDGLQLLGTGQAKIIWSTVEAPLDWKFTADLFGREEIIEKYPEATKRLVRAQIRAARYYSTHPDEYLAEFSKFMSIPQELWAAEWKHKSVKAALSPVFDDFVAQHYQQVIDYAFENKLIRRKFAAGELLEPRFDEAVLRELALTTWETAPAESAGASRP